MNKPVTITTPTNFIALAVYAAHCVLGVVAIANLIELEWMVAFVGAALTDIWALAVFCSGMLALMSAVSAYRRPVSSLKLEIVALVGLSVLDALLTLSIFLSYGLTRGVLTQTLVSLLVVAFIGRAFQARYDRNRALDTIRHPAGTAVVAGEKEDV